ncbi:stalk domain-containing protein [Paenibacillus elgii]|uniref:stalk domain-containing protein n=1 Tax=Paenibacillus elgii TaxID=189691 RepID=UPI002041F533|nr:stalk domain-containing protein [Paenibacillus elgii]MCM3270762.1 copper amine oxidase N-terminal domain-containing protein [Paenibacillus elgii]
MSKKWMVSILTLTALIMLSGTVFASSSLKISINGVHVQLPNEAKLEDGQLLVPIRWITENLGATLNWSETESSINIKTANQIQIDRFMDVKRNTTARKLVELWLQGVRTRSGSLQYATLSPQLQQATFKTFENQYWGTGGSSPWIENVVIGSEEKVKDDLVRFVIEYDLASSNWHWSGGRKEITVERIQSSPYEEWQITSIHTKSNEYEIVTPSETVDDTEVTTTSPQANGSVNLTDDEAKAILNRLIPKAVDLYGMFNGSDSFKVDKTKTIPGEEGYAQVIDENFKSVADLKKAVEDVFTIDCAQKIFYSRYLTPDKDRPLYKEYEGKLYVDKNNGGHGWATEFLIDTAKLKGQKDQSAEIELDTTVLDDPGDKLTISIVYVNDKWFLASRLD